MPDLPARPDGGPGGPRLPGSSRGPLAGLSELAEFLGDERRQATFLRGLTIGALVGAAIAGSRIWRRRRPNRPETGEPE